MLPSGRRLPDHQLQSLRLSCRICHGSDPLTWGLVAVSSDSNSGCLEKFLLEFVELGFRITLGFESLFRVRFKVEVILYSCASCF